MKRTVIEQKETKVTKNSDYSSGMTPKRKEFVWLVGLAVLLVLVCLPRFNRWDLGVARWTSSGQLSKEMLSDAGGYVKTVEYFRGERDATELSTPFQYRPLVPLLASWLPFAPMTSLNVVNVLALIAALVAIWVTVGRLGYDLPAKVVGGALFVLSFPTFYYGAIGIVDPAAILFVAVGVMCIVQRHWLAVVIILAVGVLAKETVAVLIPATCVALLTKQERLWRSLIITGACVIVFILAYKSVRIVMPGEVYIWLPSWSRLSRNVERVRTYTSFVLAFGLPGLLSLGFLCDRARLWRKRLVEDGPFLIGILAAIGLWCFSLVSAHTDGRFIWVSYPFMIPLAVGTIERWWQCKAMKTSMNADVSRNDD